MVGGLTCGNSWHPLLVALALRCVPAWTAREEVHITVGDDARGFILHTPETPCPAEGCTVVLVLHGSTEDHTDSEDDPTLWPARRFERNYDSSYFAQDRANKGYAQVYLSARVTNGWYCWDNAWQGYGSCAGPADGKDDVYVHGVVENVRARLQSIKAVYLFGMSGGSKMAWKLACSSSAQGPVVQLDGIAAMAGPLSPALQGHCCCSTPAIVAFHGVLDHITDVSLADNATNWFTAVHGCGEAAALSPQAGVHLTNYFEADCQQSRMAYYRLDEGGHTIPGGPVVWRPNGNVIPFDSLDAIWSFWTSGEPPPSSVSLSRRFCSTAACASCSALFFVQLLLYDIVHRG